MQCTTCGNDLRENARYCSRCGSPVRLPMPPLPIERPRSWSCPLQMTAELEQSLANASQPIAPRADVIFAIDTTGSMSGKIEGLLRTCLAFSHELASCSIDYRLGLIGFGDLPLKEKMSIYPPTAKVDVFQEWIRKLPRTAGGDAPESSLDAVREALRMDLRPDAQRVIILITDAPPHDPDMDGYTAEKVIDLLLQARCLTFCIAPDLECWKEMAHRTEGEWFKIESDADFLSIISRLAKSVSETVTVRLTGKLPSAVK